MKTLEQWQKELPDYELAQGWDASAFDWPECEVWTSWPGECSKWAQMSHEKGLWGARTPNGDFIFASALMSIGATFRRKKERQREFKIELDEEFSYKIDGDKHTELGAFLEKRGILSATLTANEWGGE